MCQGTYWHRYNNLLKEGNGVSVSTAAYSPEANAAERVHKTLTQRLRARLERLGQVYSPTQYMATMYLSTR
jgi:hypothetical protein